MYTHRLIQWTGGISILLLVFVLGLYFFQRSHQTLAESVQKEEEQIVEEPVPVLDTQAYDAKMLQLANRIESIPTAEDGETVENTQSIPEPLWPVTDAPYPNVGAILPFNRIVAYYGNFYSKGMGILGEYDQEEVLRRLQVEVEKWNQADPETPVVPAIDYIAVTAQASAGADGMYRFRMPDAHVDKAIEMAKQVDGIVILEIQAGKSNLMDEIRHFEHYLSQPQVHLAIDPEFAMKYGQPPGTVVGTVDATQINEAAEYLATLVNEFHLPPKILIVHRYTRAMVTHADQITPLPEVQIVMDMDGWGPPEQKFDTYQAYIYSEPVQFTGFKLFYKNDVKRVGSKLLTPQEILELTPQPSFIQYQ